MRFWTSARWTTPGSRRTAVVVQRPREFERDRSCVKPAEGGELVLEGAKVVHRGRREDVRDVTAVDEREGRDLALERRREDAHLPNPRMLERVVLGLDEDMEG
jgi:hypothetical protein